MIGKDLRCDGKAALVDRPCKARSLEQRFDLRPGAHSLSSCRESHKTVVEKPQALEAFATHSLGDNLDHLGESEGRVGEAEGEAATTALDDDVVVDDIGTRRDGGGMPDARLVDEGLGQGEVEGQVLGGLYMQGHVPEGSGQV